METLDGNSEQYEATVSSNTPSSSGGVNSDDNNSGDSNGVVDSITWYGMRLRSPLSFLLDYSGILRSTHDSDEAEIVNNIGVPASESRSQLSMQSLDSAAVNSPAGEVAIRIIGVGEHDHDQNQLEREVGTYGDDLIMGERGGVSALDEGRGGIAASERVPLVSSSASSSSLDGSGQVDGGGDAAGNGMESNSRDSSSYQRYDIQQVAKWIEQILPFSLLLLVVFIRQHLQGITTSVLIHWLCYIFDVNFGFEPMVLQ